MSEEASFRQKLNKKLKVAIGKSKQGTKKDYIRVQNDIQKGGERNSKARSEGRNVADGRAKHEPVTPGRRRKRVSSVPQDAISHDDAEAPYGKALSSRKVHQGKGKNKSIRSIWVCDGPEDVGSINKPTSLKLKNAVKSSKLKTNSKRLYRTDIGAKGSLKKLVQTISNSSKRLESPLLSAKETVLDKKTLVDDSEVLDVQPKKRKRVIRLDPYDISNKRLDDGMAINENTKEKKKDLEKDAEMSKNAQFRAIQPCPSMLSFVEDNLLGRRRLIELRQAGYNTELSAPLDNVPFSTSSERERIEENIFRNKLTFFAAAKVSSSFPPPDVPEIAFAGRSNVGKSSLLNALTRQWGVVRTSDRPGHTQTINFFKLGSKLCLVDLPGYGFAYAKEEVKDAWEELVKEYVSTRVGLKRVCLLIDTKWGMKPRDHELIALMERYQAKYQVVLTKTDTVFPADVARCATQIEESLKANKSVVQPVMMVSSKSGAGIQSLRTVLAKIARFAKL